MTQQLRLRDRLFHSAPVTLGHRRSWLKRMIKPPPPRLVLFYGSVAIHLAMAQSMIRVTGLPGDHISLFDNSSSEFTTSVTLPESLRDVAPYAVMITNESDRGVIAYHIRWTCTDAAGRVTNPDTVIFDFSSFGAKSTLPPGESHLALPGMRAVPAKRTPAVGFQEEARANLEYYGHQREITAAIDAVVFADGVAAGPDSGHWIPRWKAHIDAERDTLSLVADGRSPDPTLQLQAIVDEARARARPFFVGGDVTAERLALIADSPPTYEDAYVLLRGVVASNVLRNVNRYGAEEARRRAAAYLNGRHYPNIHLKGSER